jgi:hypothetical protein
MWNVCNSRCRARNLITLAWASVVFLATPITLPAAADTTAAEPAAAGAATFGPLAAFQGSTGGVTANMNMCFGAGDPLSTMITQIQGAMGKNKSGGACGNASVPGTVSTSCSDYAPSGTFDPAMLKKEETVLSTANTALTCQKNELTAVQSELTCIKQQGNLMTQQISQLSSVFQQNITRMQTALQGYKQRVADRTNQIDFVNKMLGGNSANGKEGLIQLQTETQAMVNQALPDEINKVTQQAQSIAQQQQMITEQINQRELALMNDCFVNQAGANYRCTPNGPPVSAQAYVLCRYQQSQSVVGNNFETNNIVQSAGSGNTMGIQSILTSIFQNTPTNSAFPTTPAAQQQGFSNTFTQTSLSGIQQQYISQLAQYNTPNFNVEQWVAQAYQACYTQAQNTVSIEQTEASSAIGAAEFAVKQTTQTNQTEFTKDLQTYSQQWSKVMGTLSSQFSPMDVSQCMNATPSIEGNCLTNIQTQMQGLLNGTATSQAFVIPVPSQFPDTAIAPQYLTCQGLAGCVQMLQQRSTDLNTAKTTLTNQQSAYVTQAKQSTQAFITQMGQMLGPQNVALQQKVDGMNSLLLSLGVSGNIKFPPVEKEPLQFDEDGLPKMPDSMVNLVGGTLSPPLLNVASGDTDLGAIADKNTTIGENQQKIADLSGKLTAMESSCPAGASKDALSAFNNALNKFTGDQCTTNTHVCQAGSTIDTLDGDMTNVAGALLTQMTTTNTTIQAINTTCNNLATGSGAGGPPGSASADPCQANSQVTSCLSSVPAPTPGQTPPSGPISGCVTNVYLNGSWTQVNASDIANLQTQLQNACNTSTNSATACAMDLSNVRNQKTALDNTSQSAPTSSGGL